MSITLHSTAFEAGQAIPGRHTGDGQDLSPELAWSGLPEGTQELALVVDDPDAPTAEPWVHWVLYKIPPQIGALAEGVPHAATLAAPAGAMQGPNSWGTTGYRGPLPPPGHGVHRYRFRLYALSRPVEAGPGLDKAGLLQRVRDAILDEGELVGTYRR